jgi:hypothetical protein
MEASKVEESKPVASNFVFMDDLLHGRSSEEHVRLTQRQSLGSAGD